jgi:hypothetical protein
VEYPINIKKLVWLTLILAILYACAFVPKITDEQKYASTCDMVTKNLTLSAQQIEGNLCRSGDDIESCLMIYGIVIPAGSFVISGGITLVGNTLHWLEYQGTCEDSALLKGMRTLKKDVK